MSKKSIVIVIVCLFISWLILEMLQKFTRVQPPKASSSSALEQKMKSISPQDLEKVKKMMGQ